MCTRNFEFIKNVGQSKHNSKNSRFWKWYLDFVFQKCTFDYRNNSKAGHFCVRFLNGRTSGFRMPFENQTKVNHWKPDTSGFRIPSVFCFRKMYIQFKDSLVKFKHVRNFVIFFWNLRNVHRYEISHSHSHAKVHYSQKIRKIIGNFTKLYSILYNFVKFYTIIWIFIQVYKCLCNYTKFRISHSHAKFLYNYSYLWIREKKICFRTSLVK